MDLLKNFNFDTEDTPSAEKASDDSCSVLDDESSSSESSSIMGKTRSPERHNTYRIKD